MTTFNPTPLRTAAANPPLHRRSAGAARRADATSWARALAIYLFAPLATLGIIATCAAHYTGRATTPPPSIATHGDREQMALPRNRTPRIRLVDIGESWPRSLFESLFGGDRRSEPRRARRPTAHREPRQTKARSSPRNAGRQHDNRAQNSAYRNSHSHDGATYRTMCVRLCDGYYWPISFASPRSNFDRDSKTCERSCSSPTALYYYRNPGGEPEDMVNLKGLPYKNLSTAFLHRAAYDASCKCRPHPWEKEALERHDRYAHPDQSRAAVQWPRQ